MCGYRHQDAHVLCRDFASFTKALPIYSELDKPFPEYLLKYEEYLNVTIPTSVSHAMESWHAGFKRAGSPPHASLLLQNLLDLLMNEWPSYFGLEPHWSQVLTANSMLESTLMILSRPIPFSRVLKKTKKMKARRGRGESSGVMTLNMQNLVPSVVMIEMQKLEPTGDCPLPDVWLMFPNFCVYMSSSSSDEDN